MDHPIIAARPVGRYGHRGTPSVRSDPTVTPGAVGQWFAGPISVMIYLYETCHDWKLEVSGLSAQYAQKIWGRPVEYVFSS
eukprot:762492-Hanusia_phi.AAC.1